MPRGKSPKGRRGGRKSVESRSVGGREGEVETDLNCKTVDELEHVETDHKTEECTDVGDDMSSLESHTTTQTLECSADVKSSTFTNEEMISIEESDSGGEGVEKCLKTMDKISTAEEKRESQSILVEDDSIQEVKDIGSGQEQEMFIREKIEAKLLESVDKSDNTEEMDTNINVMNAEMNEQKVDGLKCTDKSTNEDQHLLNVTENSDTKTTNATLNTEFQKLNETTGKPLDSNVNFCIVTADLMKTPISESQELEESENNKFEEISEGSIEQVEQDDLIAESFSDVEITGESFEPKKIQNDKNGNSTGPSKKSESVEVVLFATKNDVKITVENKENDEISDTSLSDHVDADLSLEEISDDDLEPSKKRRKSSGQTEVKAGNDIKEVESTKPDLKSEGKSDNIFEKVMSDTKVQKRPTNDDIDHNRSSNKRLKPSDEKNDTEVVSSNDEQEPTLSADKCGDSKKEEKRTQTKDAVRNLSQSSSNWNKESSERLLSARDFVSYSRKYDLVDSSCQSEPVLLKGKIVQCSINPIKSSAEFRNRGKNAESDSTVSEFVKKFKHRLPSSIPDNVLSDITSLQPPQKKGYSSFSMGPLMLSDVVCSEFRDDVLSASENFSLIFGNPGQGILKATFPKHDNVASLFTLLNHKDLNNRYLIVSVLSCEEQESSCACKAILLLVNEPDKETESQVTIRDEGNEAKLYLNGMPKAVNTTFIHLLFPEAQNVVIDGDGFITLDFSSVKMVDGILSSYGLLIINGSQVNLSRTKSQNCQNVTVPADANKESVTIIKVGIELEGDQSEGQGKICTDFEQGAKSDNQHKEETDFNIMNQLDSEKSEQQPDTVVHNDGDLREVTSPGNDDSLALDGTLDLDRGDKIISDVPVISSTDLGRAVTNIAEGTSVADMASTSDDSTEMIVLRDENITSESVFEMNESKKQVEECESVNKEDSPNKVITEEENKVETNMQDITIQEEQLLSDKEIECDGGMSTQENNNVSDIKEVYNVVGDNDKAMEVNDVEAHQKVQGENFEDVSDDEMIHQNKLEDFNQGILKPDSLKREFANADVTNESHDSVIVINNEGIKDPIIEGVKQSDNQCSTSDGTQAEVPCGSGIDSKLVLTDGDLEVLMEVIDVSNDSGEAGKVLYPNTWNMSQDRSTGAAPYFVTRRENLGGQSSYASKSGIFNSSREHQRNHPAEIHVPGASQYHYSWSSRKRSPSYRESSAQKRDSFLSKHRHSHTYASGHHRTSSTEQWSKGDETQHPHTYENARKVDSYSKPVSESRGRPRDLHGRTSRSMSLSNMSESSNNQESALCKSPHKKDPVLHTSRSPISISSRSHSLSPVSKSPSLDLPETGAESEELVKTVEHFLKIAKGIQQTRKRQHDHSTSHRLTSSRHSPPRSRSPYSKQSWKLHPVKSRDSRSPTYARSSRYKYERSLSPVSYGGSSKRCYENKSPHDRKYPRDNSQLRHYESERSQRSKQYSYEQKSGKWSEQKNSEHYRNQSWQQSFGGNQAPNCLPVATNNLYNPSFPPPGCPPTVVQPSLYPGSSMPMFQYNSQSHFNYSNMPPSVPPPPLYAQTAPPPPSFAQPYQPFPAYRPRF